MERNFRVDELLKRRETILLPAELAAEVGTSREVVVEFGAARARATLATGQPHRPGYVAVSGDLIARLHIPQDCAYQVVIGPGWLRFGPVIGLLAARTPEDLTPRRLYKLSGHLLAHAHRGGLYVAFDARSISVAERVVRGHYFVWDGGWKWRPATLPLPTVIHRRFGAVLGSNADVVRPLGVRVFNERRFGKEETWQWLSNDPLLRSHLPETVLLRSMDDVLAMLDRFEVVFVKPDNGSQGRGIIRIERRDGQLLMDLSGSPQQVCGDLAALRAALAPHLPRRGVVQQGLALARAGRRLVDFRAVLQKDGGGHWAVTGIVGRCGPTDLALSNVSLGGCPLPVEQGLQLLFGPSPCRIFRRRQELTELALAVGAALDRTGLLLGNLGLDVAYDVDDRPWIIEVNNRDPDHTIASDYGDMLQYYAFRSAPMHFAWYLAGFGAPSGGGRL